MPKAKAEKQIKIPKTGILLPRPLSWSGLDLWEKDPDEYIRVYFKGGKTFQNDAMRFGSHIADMLCGKAKPQNHTEQSVKLLAHKYNSPEHHIEIVLDSNVGKIPLNGYIDDLSTEHFNFIENKTGTTKWSFKKAENHGQLHFYYLLIILATGTRPRQGMIQHLETVKAAHTQFGRALTGNIYHYEVELSVGHEMEIRRRIENAAREIDKAYRQFISSKIIKK